MNEIIVLEPRWHDRTVLIADWKIADFNKIVIKHKEFPVPFYADKEQLKRGELITIKTKKGQTVNMRVIPLSELSTDLLIDEL